MECQAKGTVLSRCAEESTERDCVGNYEIFHPCLFTADEEGSLKSIYLDRPERERDMSILRHRLATFKQGPLPWPRIRPTPEELASAGFYYTGYENTVQCFSCDVMITDWDDSDYPFRKHHDKNPLCRFLVDNYQLSLHKGHHESSKFSGSTSRLHSFSTWPISHLVSSFQLASAGFYFSGVGCKVRCFSCGLEYEKWRAGDIPVNIHRQYSPQCTFLNSLLQKDPSVSTTTLLSMSDSTLRTPDYANEIVRLKSFKHLSKTFPVSKEECAKAGLYFLRKPDVMKCFSCDVELRCWIEGDVPVEKHKRMNSNCKFLKEFFPCKLDSLIPVTTVVDPNTLPEPKYSQSELKLLSHEDTIDPASLPEPFLTPTLHKESNQEVSSMTGEDHSSSLDDSNKVCVVCMDAPLQMVLVPCGHMCVCEECSSQILQCPMCRTPTENALKVFLP